MSRLHAALPVLFLAAAGAPVAASAAAVCVAKPNTPMSPVTVVGGAAAPAGFLASRQCFGVLERLDGRTRVLVKGGGFRGEMELPNENLLYVLAEDIPLRLKEGEEPWGLALAGTGVMIESATATGHVVRTVDGRVQARFLVEEGAMLPAGSWPSLEPDEVHPGGKWPEATHALPPTPVALQGTSGTRANVSAPLFALDDVLLDPAIGALRYVVVDADADRPETVRIVGPTLWVEGTVQDIDWRRETLRDEENDGAEREDWDGWDDGAGYAIAGPASPLPREIASKEAPISIEAKGERFAVLEPGARVSVGQTDGGWMRLEHVWPGGIVNGWADKKRLVKEGKEQTTPQVVIPKATVVTVQAPTVAWVNKGPEFATDKEGQPKLDKEGNQVVDPNETHTEEPDYPTAWLRRAVRERIDRLRFFYGRALATNPALAGSIGLVITIDEAGAMTMEFADGSLADEDLRELVSSAIEDVELPERTLKKARRDLKDYSVTLEMTVLFSPLKG